MLRRAFPLRLLLFGFGLVVFLGAVEFQLERNMPAEGTAGFQKYDEIFHPRVRADVAVIGSSTAMHSIDPRVLSGTSSKRADFSRTFNFASAGAKMSFQRGWYELLFSRYYPKPSLVLFGVDPFSFNPSNPRRLEHDASAFPPGVIASLALTGKASVRELLLNRFSIYTIHHNRGELMHVFFPRQRTEPADTVMARRGFVPLQGTLPADAPTRPQNVIAQEEIAAFTALLDDLKRDGIDVILVVPPLFLRPGDEPPDDGFIRQIARERGIPYLRHSGEEFNDINANPLYFSDAGHLNGTGAQVFTALLKQELEALPAR